MVNSKLSRDFFKRDTHVVCQELIGKFLIRKSNNRVRIGKIVEVEAYQGFDDKASHAAKKKTARNEVMFGASGYYYVYLIYGMYFCLNIVTETKDFPAAILIRAVEPIYDSTQNLAGISLEKKRTLGSGPGRLCRWMGVDKTFSGKSVENNELYLTPSVMPAPYSVVSTERKRVEKSSKKRSLDVTRDDKSIKDNKIQVAKAKRIGVHYAGESAHLDWRYYDRNSQYISQKQ